MGVFGNLNYAKFSLSMYIVLNANICSDRRGRQHNFSYHKLLCAFLSVDYINNDSTYKIAVLQNQFSVISYNIRVNWPLIKHSCKTTYIPQM